MATVPGGLVRRVQIDTDVERAKAKLGPEALDVSYRLDTNSIGEPSIFFRIILADWATQEDQLSEVTGRITASLLHELCPYENWGVWPYFNYGSEAEWKKSGARRAP